jgi:3-hydroxyisobutyrate dehydrogenase-like beta-hydroxyacid dehydrogenase
VSGQAVRAEATPNVAHWLIVGHGSVGSALARRISRHGAPLSVYDPSPRVAVVAGDHLIALDARIGPFDYVISCVVPSAARHALDATRPVLKPTTVYLEWNTLTPAAKREIAEAAPCPVVDVALLDTLDDEAAHPSLAISGPQAEAVAPPLASLDFRVDVVGANCGDAALLKLARSLFMKSLEALVVEFEAALAPLVGRDVVVGSIERNLGPRFTDFSRMLLETDRIHASRRSVELEEAVDVFRSTGASVRVAAASIDVLRAAAAAWRAPDAPGTDAGGEALARFLAKRLNADGGRRAAR